MRAAPEWTLWLLVLGIVVYEWLALFDSSHGNTISEVFWRLSSRPIVPFVFGLLAGHLFWQKG